MDPFCALPSDIENEFFDGSSADLMYLAMAQPLYDALIAQLANLPHERNFPAAKTDQGGVKPTVATVFADSLERILQRDEGIELFEQFVSQRTALLNQIDSLKQGSIFDAEWRGVRTRVLEGKIADLDHAFACKIDACGIESVAPELYAFGAGGAGRALAGGLVGRIAARGSAAAVQEGTTLYRVFGGEARGLGQSWTTVNPGSVKNFREAAGLFPGNTGQFVIEGTLMSTEGVLLRQARPGPGGIGGTIPEVVVSPGAPQICVLCVSGANPAF
jgi:hypothetical protein